MGPREGDGPVDRPRPRVGCGAVAAGAGIHPRHVPRRGRFGPAVRPAAGSASGVHRGGQGRGVPRSFRLMLTPIARFDRAVASSLQVLAGVEPSHMDGSTPCASWNVREVLNHMIGASDFFVVNIRGARPVEAAEGVTDYGSGDYRLAFEESAAAQRAAFTAPGVLDSTIDM